MICRGCGKEKVHEARGLCKACYMRYWKKVPHNLDGFLLHSTKLKDAPLASHQPGQDFSLKGANCPDYTTPKCARCNEWIEFMDQVGGIDFCNPEEGCVDCEYGFDEACPCSARSVG